MNCYFDTSVYNQLLDDGDRESIIARIRERRIVVVPSIVNLCEILQTPDAGRKNGLIEIYHQVRNDYHALKPFTTILRDSVYGIQRGETEVIVNMPIAINPENELLCKEVLKNKGTHFDLYTKRAREWLVAEEVLGGDMDSRLFFELMNQPAMDSAWIELFVGSCRGLGIEELTLDEDTILRIIRDFASPWKYYIDTQLLFFYRRAIRAVRYGRKTNPEGADLEQGIYLSWADIFVLDDGIFLEFIGELKEVRRYPKKIMSYSEFKSFLGFFNRENR